MRRTLKAILVRAQERWSPVTRNPDLREYQSNPAQNVGGVMNSKDHSNEVSDGNEEQVTGQQQKRYPSYKVARNWAEMCLCPTVLFLETGSCYAAQADL
jgi:hypothetical protein